MKKIFLLIAIAILASASANAYMINLSCKAVQGVSPDFFNNDPNEWKEYVADLEKGHCGNSDNDEEEDDDSNPTVLPGQQ